MAEQVSQLQLVELELARKGAELEAQKARSNEFARVALKNGNALLLSEARVRHLEALLDELLEWASRQGAPTNNAVRSILNDYIEDDQKHTTSPS